MISKNILLATVFAASLPAFAFAEEDPTTWYFSGEVGANWAHQEGDFTGGTTSYETDYETGWALFFSVGHQWDNLRLEFELGWRDNDGDTFDLSTAAPVALSDGTTQFSQMANLLYDLDVTDDFELSLGGGVGGVLVESEWELPTGTRIIDDEDYVFAYQLMANATYEIRANTDFFIGYRYTRTDNAEMDFTLAPPVQGEDVKTDSHTVTFGIRHFFDVEAEAPMAAATPEPVMAPKAPDTFIVFFDFNKWSLSAEAQAVVAEAAEAFAKTGAVHVKVVGHTDTVGSSNYNQALSERRAASVAAEMVRLGVPNTAISTEGRGFGDPMVPTGPGVREPQNRRAVIQLD